jgi:hypothetical protein
MWEEARGRSGSRFKTKPGCRRDEVGRRRRRRYEVGRRRRRGSKEKTMSWRFDATFGTDEAGRRRQGWDA